MVSNIRSVCFIVTTISRAGAGVAEATRNQALNLQRRGVNVSVVTLRDAYFDEDVAGWKGIEVFAYRRWGPAILGFSPFMLSALWRLRPDIVHVQGVWQFHCLVAYLWSFLTGKPYVISPHGMMEPWIRERSPRLKALISFMYHNRFLRRCDGFQLLTDKEQTDVGGFIEKQTIAVIPNSVTVPDTSDELPAWWKPEDIGRRHYLFLGRIHEKKGCTELCEAWEWLNLRHPDAGKGIMLIFCGWNDGLPKFEETIDSLAKRFGNVRFVGPQYGIEKWRSIRACDVLVLPSRSEGLPMVVLEAWAASRPTIMTKECNLPEGFDIGAALQTQLSRDSLSDVLYAFYAMKDENLERMERASRKIINEKYSEQSVTERLLAFYSSFLPLRLEENTKRSH